MLSVHWWPSNEAKFSWLKARLVSKFWPVKVILATFQHNEGDPGMMTVYRSLYKLTLRRSQVPGPGHPTARALQELKSVANSTNPKEAHQTNLDLPAAMLCGGGVNALPTRP